MMQEATEVRISPKLVPLFAAPRGHLRYRCAHGGRGSSKSFSFAKMAAVLGYAESLKILCTREFQVSIKDSFYAELEKAIKSESWLDEAYDIGENYIRSKINNTRFIFKGLQKISTVKSMSGIDLCIIEEAEDVSEVALLDLEPTIREPKSEIWVLWNPKERGSPVDNRFRGDILPPRTMVVEVNHPDNPWFPKELEEQRLYAQRTMDPATYRWIWEGGYLENSEVQIFASRCRVAEFVADEINWHGPYYGMDFGFSTDPTAAVKVWINGVKLMIEYEAYEYKLDIDETADKISKSVPGILKGVCRADNARPETISYLKKKRKNPDGSDAVYMPNVIPTVKGKGSVEDGIEFIKSFEEIIIHPRCKNMQVEAASYNYKVDRLTKKPTTDIVDANNHLWDSVRYAIEPLIKNNNFEDILKMSMMG